MPRLLPLLFCFAGPFLHAQYGALDPTFGDGGLVTFPSGMGNDLVIQSDGKILVTGTIIDSLDQLTLIRYLPDGQRDPAFGNDGVVLLPDQPYGATGWRIALQADGKILVAGGHNFTGLEQPDLLLVRFLPNGHLDTSFGTNGWVTWDAFGDLEVTHGLIIQSDGKILLTGYTIETMVGVYAFMVRFTSDGHLDLGFGHEGALILDFNCTIFEATGMAELNDGKIIVCATCKSAPEIFSHLYLMRFMPDGTYDASFGNNGSIQHDFGIDEESGQLQVQPDGKYLVVTIADDGITLRFAVSRFLPDGNADLSFGQGGLSIVDFGPNISSAVEIAIQPDGKIIAVGVARNNDPLIYDELIVARFLTNGSLDPTFGDSGIVKTNFRAGASDIAMAVALQPDHKIVVTGYTHPSDGVYDIILARYLSNYEPPPYDTSARDELFQLYPNPTAGTFTVQFGLSRSTTISLDVYDMQGRFLQALLPSQMRAEGIYTEPLVLGQDIPSGAYALVMTRDGVRQSLPVVKQY